jgi:hypothetical protein
MSSENLREGLVDYLRSSFIGPLDYEEKGRESEEVIGQMPSSYFSTGKLYPIPSAKSAGNESKERGDEEWQPESVSIYSDSENPSSMGIEVALPSLDAVESIVVDLGLYYRVKHSGKNKMQEPSSISPEDGLPESNWRYKWKRKPIHQVFEGPEIKELLEGKVSEDVRLKHSIGYLRLVYRSAPSDGGRLKVFIVNDGVPNWSSDFKADRVIHQPEITINAKTPGFCEIFPGLRSNLGVEERCIMMRHRNCRTFALTYGCASNWDTESSQCSRVSTTFLPRHSIHGLTFKIEGHEGVLSQAHAGFGLLSSQESDWRGVIEDFRKFVKGCEDWITDLTKNNPSLDPESEEVLLTMGQCEEAAARMKDGIEVLEVDPMTRKAFGLANVAMLMQFAHKSKKVMPKAGIDLIGQYRGMPPECSKWRPFQLAFLLLSIETACNPDSKFRKGLDLIWFPTGGGKTEAYLGLAAFTILLDRLRTPDASHGTTVLSRYTLRLLTYQQSERTSALICALELLRRNEPRVFGETPISLGLWVGGNNLPNTLDGAEELLEQLLENDDPTANNPFIFKDCPCCGSSLLPSGANTEEYRCGFSIANQRLTLQCPQEDCLFHDDELPIHLVDNQIYDVLPTFVIGTIDKFASLAWKEGPGFMLTGGEKGASACPVLIIQDELHLISGPLGTLAGVYECAVDALCSTQGVLPHMVASTATMIRADEQCSALYGRKVRQFPPPGLDESDSYFARKDRSSPGRLYVGVMGIDRSVMKGTNRLHAILLQAVQSKSPDPREDAYWTLVSFFNNKRQMGMTTTATSDDIPTWINQLEPDEDKRRILRDLGVEDLHADKGNAADVSGVFRRLSLPRNDPNNLSLLLTTNIIAVGVDVPRLGFMLVNGQPQTTSEYIQVTSRIGRDSEMPGLVVSFHYANRPRDRSRFESFLPFHMSLYANVEPTSVTPFSKPSRDRALHALAIILARNLEGGLRKNDEASDLLSNPDIIHKVNGIVKGWLQKCAPDEIDRTLNDLDYLFQQWKTWAEDHNGLCYDSRKAKAIESLLHRKIDPLPDQVGWFTMDSMRNVDHETFVKVVSPR